MSRAFGLSIIVIGIIVCFLQVAGAQITVVAEEAIPEQIKEYASPMTITLPVYLNEKGIWATREAAGYVCERSSLDRLEIETKPRGDLMELLFRVWVTTRPPKDNWVSMKMTITSDVGPLVTHVSDATAEARSQRGFNYRPGPMVLKADAEESDTTKKRRMCLVKRDSLRSVMRHNPKLVIEMVIERN